MISKSNAEKLIEDFDKEIEALTQQIMTRTEELQRNDSIILELFQKRNNKIAVRKWAADQATKDQKVTSKKKKKDE